METIELHLDVKTLDQARQLAAAHQWPLDELVAQAIQKYAEMEAQNYPLLGLFVDEPTVVDEMMESVNRDRDADLQVQT